jgi:hypothetical protein
VSDVRQIEVHITEPLVPGPRHFEIEIDIGNLKKYKSLGRNQIRAKMFKAGGKTLLPEINNPINSIWNKEEFKMGDKTG